MRRKILLLVGDQHLDQELLYFLGSQYEIEFSGQLQDSIQKISEFKFYLIFSFIFPSPNDWYRFISAVRVSSLNNDTPIVLDDRALTDSPDSRGPDLLGVDVLMKLSLKNPELVALVGHDFKTGMRPREAFYANRFIQTLIHQINENDLSLLRNEVDKLKAANLTLTNELNDSSEKIALLQTEVERLYDSFVVVDNSASAKQELRKSNGSSDLRNASEEEKSERSQLDLEVIFNNAYEAILVLDRSGKAVFFNQAHRQFIVTATGQEPWIGKPLKEITVPERRAEAESLFQKSLSGETNTVEVRLKTLVGYGIHQLNYSPVIIDDEVRFVTIISTDITRNKLQEENLKRSEANLRAIFNNTDDAFTLLDADLNIVAFNENNYRDVLEITGKALAIGESVFSTLPENRAEGFRAIIDKVNQGDIVRGTTHYKSDSFEKWYDVSIQAVHNERNDITGYSITSRNATDFKLAEFEILRLNKSLLNFQTAIHRSSIVSITDCNGNITFVNDNFVSISGYSYDELIGKNHRIMNSAYHPKSFWMNMWKTISNGEVWRSRVRNRAKDGSFYWVDTFIMPFKDEEGKIYQYLSIRSDITSLKNAEHELLQKQLLLQQASRLAKIGYYVIDEKSKTISLSPELLEILQLSEIQFRLIYNDRNHDLHDLIRRLFDVETLLEKTETDNVEFRYNTSEGEFKWLHRRSNFTVIINNDEKVIGTIQDITEQKGVQQALNEFNERFEMLSRATNDAIWDLDLKRNIIVWNHAIHSTFGYNENKIEHTREWWQQRVHPEDFDLVYDGFNAAISQRQNSWSQIFRFQCANGSFRFVHNRCYILYDLGDPVRAIGSLQDITEMMEANAEIRKLSLVASKTNSGVMITDENKRVEWANESFTRLTGYSLNEILGKSPTLLQGSETDPEVVRRMSEKLRKHEPVSEEIINYTKSGAKFWVKLEIVPVFNDNGELRNFISIQTDITELKEYENSITAIAQELSTLIENANVPIFGVDVSGKINEWNSVCVQLFGYSREEALGRNCNEIFKSATSNILRDIINIALLEAVSNFELPVITKGEDHLMLLLSASPRKNKNKHITGVIFVGQNITELIDYRLNLERKVEERTRDLHQALSKEQEVVRLKNQFISIASHEFRTPLTTIALASGFIKKYKERLTTQLIEEKVGSIQKQVTHMTSLLDDILVVGKADAGKLPVHLKPLEISVFVRNLAAEVAKAMGSTHEVVIHESLRYREIMSDEKLLRNIVINLLTNAIKFSPGADRVDVDLTTKMDDLHLTIRDYGVGIPESDLQNIFEPFFRGANVHSIHGTGLGLAIIKKAVDLLQGSIEVTSAEGTGTMFYIKLPI